MTFSFEETPESRSQESGDNQYHELVYTASGEFDDAQVHSYALSLAPLTVARPTGTLYRTGIVVEPVGHKLYEVRARYGRHGSATFTFDTTGATVNVQCAKEHRGSYTAAGADGDGNHSGAIKVREGGDVQGADIVIPALKLTYTYRHPRGVVNETYAKTLAGATGCTNLNPFRGFSPGELLFFGASGSDGTDAEAEVSYQFIASQNVVGMSIGAITGIAKDGHDYVWVEFEDAVVNGRACKVPLRANVERVYDPIDFASVLGWS